MLQSVFLSLISTVHFINDGNIPEQQQHQMTMDLLIIKLPTLLRLIRVRRPAVLTGVAGAGHGLLRLVRGGLLPGLLLAGDGGGGRQTQLRRLRGAQRAQVVSAQAGRQGQRVLKYF